MSSLILVAEKGKTTSFQHPEALTTLGKGELVGSAD